MQSMLEIITSDALATPHGFFTRKGGASSGIFASLVLGFGRALGETMALAMLIGNSNQISLSLFSPANTLASLLASQFPEAGGVEVEALMYAAVVLLRCQGVVAPLAVHLADRMDRREVHDVEAHLGHPR